MLQIELSLLEPQKESNQEVINDLQVKVGINKFELKSLDTRIAQGEGKEEVETGGELTSEDRETELIAKGTESAVRKQEARTAAEADAKSAQERRFGGDVYTGSTTAPTPEVKTETSKTEPLIKSPEKSSREGEGEGGGGDQGRRQQAPVENPDLKKKAA